MLAVPAVVRAGSGAVAGADVAAGGGVNATAGPPGDEAGRDGAGDLAGPADPDVPGLTRNMPSPARATTIRAKAAFRWPGVGSMALPLLPAADGTEPERGHRRRSLALRLAPGKRAGPWARRRDGRLADRGCGGAAGPGRPDRRGGPDRGGEPGRRSTAAATAARSRIRPGGSMARRGPRGDSGPPGRRRRAADGRGGCGRAAGGPRVAAAGGGAAAGRAGVASGARPGRPAVVVVPALAAIPCPARRGRAAAAPRRGRAAAVTRREIQRRR